MKSLRNIFILIFALSIFLFQSAQRTLAYQTENNLIFTSVVVPASVAKDSLFTATFNATNNSAIDFTNHVLQVNPSMSFSIVSASVRLSNGVTYTNCQVPASPYILSLLCPGTTTVYAQLSLPHGTSAQYTLTLKTLPDSFIAGNPVLPGQTRSLTIAYSYASTDPRGYSNNDYITDAEISKNILITAGSTPTPTVTVTSTPTPTSATPTNTPIVIKTPTPTKTATPTIKSSPTASPTTVSKTPTPTVTPSPITPTTATTNQSVITLPDSFRKQGSKTTTLQLLKASDEIKNVTSLVFDDPDVNSIEFTEPVDLTALKGMSTVDIERNIIIGSKGIVMIDTTQLSALNKSAKITMRGLSFKSTPKVLRNDGDSSQYVSDVKYDSNAGILTFVVKGFSEYRAVEANESAAISSEKSKGQNNNQSILVILITILILIGGTGVYLIKIGKINLRKKSL